LKDSTTMERTLPSFIFPKGLARVNKNDGNMEFDLHSVRCVKD